MYFDELKSSVIDAVDVLEERSKLGKEGEEQRSRCRKMRIWDKERKNERTKSGSNGRTDHKK